jgi:regulator of nucleoside diphosphate kinase
MQREQVLITDGDRRRLRACLNQITRADSETQRPLASLHRRVRSARIVGPKDVPANVITMNSLVVLRNLDSGGRLTCRLAYPSEARLSPRNVSVTRPLGTAMLGKRVGQVIRWPGGARDRRLRIQQVLYQPEAAGAVDL